jgi:hypothetical protein
MSYNFRRLIPIAALALATLLGGCVVVPERPFYRHAMYSPAGMVYGGEWGHRHYY